MRIPCYIEKIVDELWPTLRPAAPVMEKSKPTNLWVAVGAYLGERSEVKESSADLVAKYWVDAASP
jgi:hypothetical protein